MKVTYKDAFKYAARYSNKLRADDERFNRVVLVYHEDGSNFVWRDAFLMRWDTKTNEKGWTKSWFFVFTEHYGFHVFDCDEVSVSQYSKRIYKTEKFKP